MGRMEESYLAFNWMTLRLQCQPYEYPSKELGERLSVLLPQIEQLRRETETPPESMTGEEWLTLRRRLLKLQGQSDAILTELTRRLRGGATYAYGPQRSGVMPAPESDPFKDQ